MIPQSCIAVALVAAGGFVAVPAFGQGAAPGRTDNYPSRPIRLVLPFPPGGGTDAVVRVMAPKLAEAMGQQWVVDNRGGAAGNISAEIVARAAPDGYTLLLGFSTVMTVSKSLYPRLAFDPEKDFAPITQTGTSQYILIVHPSVAARTVKELVAIAKAKPGALNYASAGVASPLHMAAELFRSRAGIDIVHVPYKGGGPAAAAVLAGEAQILFGSVASSMEHIKAGRMRALGVTGLARSMLAPELPTLAESGFPGFNVTAWHSFLAPAGTPPAIVKRLHAETVRVLRAPDLIKLIHNVGYEPTGTTPEALAELIRTESQTWAKVIKEAGIRAE
jgi:tripartite-type tricarboxylate transporter receptor subunit TctC